MSNAVIYARYSSDKQSEESIEAQLRACRQYAATRGYNIVAVYADEAISGKGSMTARGGQCLYRLRGWKMGR
uniref:recombinase family protein n=1 Tax=Ruminococcus bicirculans (ex Wegman et al. 2014) TaxID=1160721 RepID=UPI00402A0B48